MSGDSLHLFSFTLLEHFMYSVGGSYAIVHSLQPLASPFILQRQKKLSETDN